MTPTPGRRDSADFSEDLSVDVRHRYRTHSVLAVPIAGRGGEVIGVLQVINKLDARGKACFGLLEGVTTVDEVMHATTG